MLGAVGKHADLEALPAQLGGELDVGGGDVGIGDREDVARVWRNNDAALLRPDDSELPCVGMIDVLTAPTSELMVRVSVVSGVTVNA